jgi:exodeoxyribonuclease-5
MMDANLFGLIGDAIENYDIKVIFVGDPMQLPPINEDHSKVFDVEANVQLTEIVRQAENSPIIELTEKIRLAIDGAPLPDLTSYDCNGVKSVNYFTWDAWFRDAFREQASNGANPDRVRALAWRNKTVCRYNDIARKELYGANTEPFVVGERVLAASPIRVMKGGYPFTIMTVDDEATIDEIVHTQHPKYPKINIIRLRMRGDDDRTINAKICAPQSIPVLKQEMDLLAVKARRGDIPWHEFYRLKKAIDDIRPCHSLTVHRSQGSTYEITFVDVADIMCNPRRREALRCLYVACSRASDFVVLG